MARWTCRDCGRQFGRANQGHECAPAMTLDAYFSTGPQRERPIFDAVWSHLSTLQSDSGVDVYVEPVSVGIFFKGHGRFAELRPMTRWVALTFNLRRKLNSERLSRKVLTHGRRHYHVINVTSPAQVDDEVREWLTEAFFSDVDG